MKKYIPSAIETKWQKKWLEENLYLTDLSETRNKYYVLVELPYTSGDLHMGHWFTFTMGDILARFKKMQGFNVLFPNGFDTFGLPAENAAIKNKMHPRDWTYANIKMMRQQFDSMGVCIDWEKTAITCDSEYYKWNQWIFLKMHEKGIAYRGKGLANWCPDCQTVLANENVELGRCWRCGTEVVQKEVDQWFFKLRAYADRLIWPASPAKRGEQDPPQVDWPKALRESQNSWIGKSKGTKVIFKIDGANEEIEVFTTRADTLFGATFIVLAPEHPLVLKIYGKQNENEVKKYISETKKKNELQRKENQEKTGVFTGALAINPVNNEKIPVWIADYALMGYGTGALFGDAHDERDAEFAKKYNIPLKVTLITGDKNRDEKIKNLEECFTEYGILVDSGQFSGLNSEEAIVQITSWLEKNGKGGPQTTYHLHDWSISRQRYWGTPIPIIYCDKCGIVPVPEKDLPVELPYKVDYTPSGKPPLALVEDWVKVKCPGCGGKAQREVETMDGFVDNSWYFYRYLDHKNNKEIFSSKKIENWIPVDIYIGGAEHTVGHTLYSRFFTKFFHDLGLISFDEYALKRINHGVILGPDGARMSKSQGNVVNPDDEVKNYGADTVRLYLMFLGPFDIVTAWNPNGIGGIYRFLQRVWGLQDKVAGNRGQVTVEDLRIMHKTIKKVTQDLEQLKYNTAIASLMEWLNYLSRKDKLSVEEYKTFLMLLAPFAPHITEELWSILGGKYSIHQQSWPEFDNKLLKEDQISIAVQINGKVRDILVIEKDISANKSVVEKMALQSQKVKKFLEGKTAEKTVYVQGKILNFVISS